MIRVAIVEDTPEEFKVLSDALIRYEQVRNTVIRQTHFHSGESFLEAFGNNFDVVFLDIALPGQSGMRTAESLRKLDEHIPLIFVTSLAQFAVKGYEVNAFDFIVKPVNYPDLEFKMDRLLQRMSARAEKKIFIKTGGQHIALLASDIRYVEIQGHTIVYHTIHGDYESYGALRSIESQFDPSCFVRCNACYLINLQYVDSVVGHDVYLGSTCLAISHPRRKDFLKALNEYLGKGV